MSAHAEGELGVGAEPPWLNTDPTPYWVTWAGVTCARSSCIICANFSSWVIFASNPSAVATHAALGNGPLGTVAPDAPEPPASPLAAPPPAASSGPPASVIGPVPLPPTPPGPPAPP